MKLRQVAVEMKPYNIRRFVKSVCDCKKCNDLRKFSFDADLSPHSDILVYVRTNA